MNLPTIMGAPDHELTRSPASLAVGRLAAESDLLMAHFEHRIALEPALDWFPEDRPDLGELPRWTGGILPESKYQGFRHDQLIGSFNPTHRAKWTTHELCHGLIGFAWRPDAPMLFHALAARLAEALPVALWYFLDESGLQRCPDHAGGGPLFNAFCRDCEQAATTGSRDDAGSDRWIVDGMAFVEREIDCVLQSARLGHPLPHRLATLDLSSDGLAYAAAHGTRLRSQQMAYFVDRFFPAGTGHHASLAALAERVQTVAAALVGPATAEPLLGDRWRWIAQDLGWRVLHIHADCEGDAADALLALADALADAPTEPGVENAVAGYVALTDEFELPEADDLLSVGYDLPGGWGRSVVQVVEGLRSGLPTTTEQLGDALEPLVRRFLSDDVTTRGPLARRFGTWLAANDLGESEDEDGAENGNRDDSLARDTARWEAALTHPAPTNLRALTLSADPIPDRVRLADGVELLTFDRDLPSVLEAAALGQEAPPVEPTAWAIRRTIESEVAIIPLELDTAQHLTTRPEGLPTAELALPEETLTLLWENAVLERAGRTSVR